MTNHPAKEKKEQEKEESIEDSSPRVTAMLPEDPLQLVTSHIYLNLLPTKEPVNNNSPLKFRRKFESSHSAKLRTTDIYGKQKRFI